jgi:RNA polymerase sigma-70 factor (ECF subfamily)
MKRLNRYVDPRLLATARYLVRNESDAQEVVQQTFEIALRNIDQLRDPDKVGAWLISIAVRGASRQRRHLNRLLRGSFRADELLQPGIDESSLEVRRALLGLPDRMRTAIVLHHMVGLSVAETAGAMRVSENTVKTQLRTGFQKLRESLR